MRIDHHAYQQATRVAGIGLVVQAALGLTLLIFGLVSNDRPMAAAAYPVLIGLLPWAGLVALFHQHRLERLEALEEDELAAGRGGAASVFERADEEIRVAAGRLRRMHQLFVPILSIGIAIAYVIAGIVLILQERAIVRMDAPFELTGARGWAVSLTLAFAGMAFIFSRFVAGMAKQTAWQNLRGGASAMVGISVVTVAIAAGIVARFFGNDDAIRVIAGAIPWYMFVLAGEIVLNFLLNVYRPRIPGDVPRPAFDSKLLSLFAAPDNIVRTVNDAVNYQFGFDITSSWGYQLLVRSFTGLAVTGIVVVLALSTLVIVEPGEQAIRLASGKNVSEEPIGSGMMLKAPWPFQSAERYEVSAVRNLPLTAVPDAGRPVETQLFSDDLGQIYNREPDPFIVLTGRDEDGSPVADAEGRPLLSLIDAEIWLQYRVRADGGLVELLDFVPDERRRRARSQLDDRRIAIRAIALRAITDRFGALTLDQVLNTGRLDLAATLRDEVQGALDSVGSGIEVTALTLPMLRPHGRAARDWEEFSVARQRRAQQVLDGERTVAVGYVEAIGGQDNVEPVLELISAYDDAFTEFGPDAPETIAARDAAANFMIESGGAAGRIITTAGAERIIGIMKVETEAAEIAGQAAPYRAAPALFRVLEEMNVYARMLPGLNKYVWAIDPRRLEIDFEFASLDPLTAITDALGEGTLGPQDEAGDS